MNSRYMKIEYCRIPFPDYTISVMLYGIAFRPHTQSIWAFSLESWNGSGLVYWVIEYLEEHLLVSSHY